MTRSPPPAAGALRLSCEKASPMVFAPVDRTTSATVPLATRLPSASTTTWSLSSTSSIRCVAQKTLMPSVSTSLRIAGEDAGARLDVQPDRRLVEQQQRRPVQQRAGDLDAPHLAARQAARLVVQAVAHLDLREQRVDAPPRLGRADAVQRGMVGEVLVDAEIEVERARLEHDAEPPAAPRRERGRCRGRRCGSSRGACRRDG